MTGHAISGDIAAYRAALMASNNGTWCFHPDYPCDRVLIDRTPVWDTLADPPRLRPDLAMACLCACPPCAALRSARHMVMGVPGYKPGIVWADLAAESNRAAMGALN